MKRKYYLITGFVSFLALTAFTTTALLSEVYESSDVTDRSIEERFIYHDDEINALGNYYTNYQEQNTIVTDYNNLKKDFEQAIIDQRKYMDAKGLTFEDFRKKPGIIPSQFKISEIELRTVSDIVRTALNSSSPELTESLNTLDEYVELSFQNSYSKLEMYADATGDDLSGKTTESFSKTVDANKVVGLKSREAVRKLKEMLQNNVLSSPNSTFTLYPNPITPASKISFQNKVSGEVVFEVFDIQGKSIRSATQNMADGFFSLDASTFIESDALPAGIYILNIRTADGTNLSDKLIID